MKRIKSFSPGQLQCEATLRVSCVEGGMVGRVLGGGGMEVRRVSGLGKKKQMQPRRQRRGDVGEEKKLQPE